MAGHSTQPLGCAATIAVHLKILAAVVLTPIVRVGFGCAGDQVLEHHYDSVERNQTEAHVLALMGQPRRISGAPEHVAWNLDATIRPNNGECVKLYRSRPD